ncbi:MAG: ABC transporter substrate-binding protein [Deltaproteobacteria bacterium]|nr:ABC transporter substrate-binding protein [Deltaproteobacteria bacterium]MBW2309171.1 ABC transporter substrate-binding protein [Deltaproteobacteria bacterium]
MQKLSYFNQRCILIAACLSAVLLLGFSYAALGADKAKYGGQYRIPLASEPTTLDPAFITGIYAVNVALNLFDGLLEFDKDLNVLPSIARIWKISRDHRTYTFLLRRGVKFHNGREVTAKDFVYSFTRILSPDTGSPIASLFFNIQGAKKFHEGKTKAVSGLRAPDPYTLKIQLEQPFAPFLSILAMANAKVVPKEEIGPGFSRNPIGTGPFRFHSWESGREILLTANKEYFEGRPFLEMLRFRIYPNIQWEKTFNDFEKGLLEQSIIPSSKYDMITSNPGYTKRYTFISKPTLNLVYVGMNVTIFPFNDYRVRQAIYHAVDIEKIVRDITKRGSIPAKGILPPGIAGFDPRFKGYSYDPDRARQLLKDAGYPQGRGIPPIEIWTVAKAESVQKELRAYQKYLDDIGIRLVPKVAENWSEFIKFINEKKAPMYYAAWYADYPDPDNFLYVLCHSKSKTNRMGYHNPDVDELLEQARQEWDYMKRVELYREVEKLVMRDAPIICQHVNSFNYLFQPWVKGVQVSYLGAEYISFQNVWIDRQ